MADGGAPPVEGAVPDVACDESAVPGSFGREAAAAPAADPLLAYLARVIPTPPSLREGCHVALVEGAACPVHPAVRYVGRLAPVAAPRGVSGDLAAALAEIPDRRSRAAKGERWRGKD